MTYTQSNTVMIMTCTVHIPTSRLSTVLCCSPSPNRMACERRIDRWREEVGGRGGKREEVSVIVGET